MKKIVYVVGTRPEIIRSAFIIKLLSKNTKINFKLLHTGQHYDSKLNDVFFEQLKVPNPDINLHIGSSNHIKQIAKIMSKGEIFLNDFRPDMVCVFGDTNSSLGMALASVKLNIPVCHIEAGIREFEMDLPEEINRRIIDQCSSLLIALSESAFRNLKNEKVGGLIFKTGDPQFTVFDYFLKCTHKKRFNYVLDRKYGLLTLHRDKNVDDPFRLEAILKQLPDNLYIIFPVHPRTKKALIKINKKYWGIFPNIKFVEPLDYISLIQVLKQASVVITDSGGLQKEAFWLKIPCVTIRKHTGWIETVKLRVNFLADIQNNEIMSKIEYIFKNTNEFKKRFKKIKNPYYKKNTTENIVRLIEEFIL